MRPIDTGSPFFSTFFSSLISVSFVEKVNPRCLQVNLFFVLHMTNKNYYAGNPYLFYGAKIILPPRILPYTIATSTMSFAPPPRPPVAAETLAILVVGVNYIVLVNQRALHPPDAKRIVLMCCCHDRISHHHPLHRITAVRSCSVKHLPRQNCQLKELYSME